MLKEYTGKVDLLISERKEAKEATDAVHAAVKQQEAVANSYQMLMPLALPAPVAGPTGYAPDPSQQFAAGGMPGYGGVPPGYGGQYTPGY
jgi:clathrin heavy chain